MSKEQLEAIAEGYGVKNVKKLDAEHLAYSILDSQATVESLKPAPEKPAQRKRGRPRKSEPAQAAEPKAEEAPKPAKPAKPAETEQPRKEEAASSKTGKKGRSRTKTAAKAEPAPVEAAPAGEPASVKYYTVDGKQTLNPQGITIKVESWANGYVKVSKIVK